jgi:hypothetical protein
MIRRTCNRRLEKRAAMSRFQWLLKNDIRPAPPGAETVHSGWPAAHEFGGSRFRSFGRKRLFFSNLIATPRGDRVGSSHSAVHSSWHFRGTISTRVPSSVILLLDGERRDEVHTIRATEAVGDRGADAAPVPRPRRASIRPGRL